MSKFGWSLPPGVTHAMIDAQFADGPCLVCGEAVDNCICPECPVCHEIGQPECYDKDYWGHPVMAHTFDLVNWKRPETNHGLQMTLEQHIGLAKLRKENLLDQVADQEQYIMHLEDLRDRGEEDW